MIDRFHSDDDVHLGVVMMNVLDQFCLCIGWSGDEDSPSVCNRLSDRVKIVVIFRGVSAPDGVGFVMDVPDRVVRMQNKSFDVRRAEVEHTRLMVINPNDGKLWCWFMERAWVRGGSIRKTSDPVHYRLRSIE